MRIQVLQRPLSRGRELLKFTWAIAIVDGEGTEVELDDGAKRRT
jgi:hypothetical protein